MRKLVTLVLAIALLFLGAASSFATTVTIPDPAPQDFIFFGQGDATVTYSGVVFAQSGALSDGFFFNVGSQFSGVAAVLSSQQQTWGDANILITLPVFSTYFSINFGTDGGTAVSFTLSNDNSWTVPSSGNQGNLYGTPDFFSVTDTPFDSVLVTTHENDLQINNITYNNTPEPGTLIMLGSGVLAGAGALRRRLAA